MPTGKVRFYDDEKGFGFITTDDGQDVFLHATVLPAGTVVKTGTRLEFGVADGKRGLQALAVRVLDAPVSLTKRNRPKPDDMAIIVEVVTDNRNRTAAEMRHIFDKSGGNLGNSGCVGWMFDKKGVIVIERTALMDEDEVMMQALDAGAADFVAQDDAFEIYTDPLEFSRVRETLEAAGYEFISAEVQMIPQNTVNINDAETIEKVERFLEKLDDNDDVQEFFHNGILPEDEEE